MIRDIHGQPISNEVALEEIDVLLGRLQEEYEDEHYTQDKLRAARLHVMQVKEKAKHD